VHARPVHADGPPDDPATNRAAPRTPARPAPAAGPTDTPDRGEAPAEGKGRSATRPSGADPRRRLGTLGESLAAAHLERLGYRVVARNQRSRHGELDLIACDGRALVFAEVKTRLAGTGPPLESLRPRKAQRIRHLAAAWLHDTAARPRADVVRFDAIGIVVDARGRLLSLDHLEGAF
jgi:putative endonuclease